jgi:hypothetical protein
MIFSICGWKSSESSTSLFSTALILAKHHTFRRLVVSNYIIRLVHKALKNKSILHHFRFLIKFDLIWHFFVLPKPLYIHLLGSTIYAIFKRIFIGIQKIIFRLYQNPQIHHEQNNTVSLLYVFSNYLYQNYFPSSIAFNRNVTAFFVCCKPSASAIISLLYQCFPFSEIFWKVIAFVKLSRFTPL